MHLQWSFLCLLDRGNIIAKCIYFSISGNKKQFLFGKIKNKKLLTLHVTPRPITTLIGREDAHKSWYSGRPLPKAILNGGLSYRARLVKVWPVTVMRYCSHPDRVLAVTASSPLKSRLSAVLSASDACLGRTGTECRRAGCPPHHWIGRMPCSKCTTPCEL